MSGLEDRTPSGTGAAGEINDCAADFTTGKNVLRATQHKRFAFRRDLLPNPAGYFQAQGLKLTGGGEWKSALCPFHNDTKPSLRVRPDTGGFRCMVCGAHGGDVLAFHMQRHGLPFIEAAKALDAWEG